MTTRERRARAAELMREWNATPPEPRPARDIRRARNAERRSAAAARGHHVVQWLGFRPGDMGSHGPAFYAEHGGTPYKDLAAYHAPEPREGYNA